LAAVDLSQYHTDSTMPLKSKSLYCFDLFHTLVSFVNQDIEGLNTHEIVGVSSKRWNDGLLNRSPDRLIGKERDPQRYLGDLIRLLKPDATQAIIDEAIRVRSRRFRDCLLDPPSEALDMLDWLRQQGKQVCLISNADTLEAAAWQDSPLAKLFDHAIFSCHCGYMKPQAEIFQLALDHFSCDATNAVFIGDGGSEELQASKALGFTTVLTTEVIQHCWPEVIEPRIPYADFHIRRWPELKELYHKES